MLARDWDIRVTPLQGLGGMWGRLTWAFARRTRSSPGCHIADLRPWQIGGLVARGNLVLAFARRTRSSPGCHMADLRPWQIGGLVARGNLVLAFARRTRSSPGCHMADLRPWQIGGLVARDVKAWGEAPRPGDNQNISAA